MKSLQKIYAHGARMTVARMTVQRMPVATLRVAILISALLTCMTGYSQTADGNAGINQANTLVRSYFVTASTLLYAIGAIIGLIGALQVYSLFVKHDQRLMSAAFTWFGGCIFLVVVAAVIQSFFGI
jgi:hypothetical protein